MGGKTNQKLRGPEPTTGGGEEVAPDFDSRFGEIEATGYYLDG